MKITDAQLDEIGRIRDMVDNLVAAEEIPFSPALSDTIRRARKTSLGRVSQRLTDVLAAIEEDDQ